MAPLTYDYLVLALGAAVNFFGTEGAPEHAFPMYTLADAVRLKEHVLRKWEAADKDPALVDDGALNVVVVGGGPTGVESAGALAELYTGDFAADYPAVPQDKARVTLVEAGPALLVHVQEGHPGVHEEGAGGARRRDRSSARSSSRSRRRASRSSPGTVLEGAHARLGRGPAGEPDRRRRSVSSWRRATGSSPGRISRSRGIRRSSRVGDIAWITDSKTKRVLPQLGSVALQAGEQAGANIARLIAGKKTEPFVYKDKGTMATIGRGAAVVQFHRGRTLKGKAASLAWGTVHLALLSTGEDRAKAMVEWSWAGFTHERPGRITVRTDEETDGGRRDRDLLRRARPSAATSRCSRRRTGTLRFELRRGKQTDRWLVDDRQGRRDRVAQERRRRLRPAHRPRAVRRHGERRGQRDGRRPARRGRVRGRPGAARPLPAALPRPARDKASG